MSGFEISHKKPRITGARLSDSKDHADGSNASDRPRDHAVDGRFLKGNTAARGTGAKRAVRHLVPARGRKIFADIMVQLGTSGGAVVALHAADATRHHLACAELTELATVAGLGTKEGAELHARAQRSSELALRAIVAGLEAARLLRHPRKVSKTSTPVGYEKETSE